MRNKCPKSYAKNGSTASRPFSSIRKKHWVCPIGHSVYKSRIRKLLAKKYICCENGRMGGGGGVDPPISDLGYGNRCRTRWRIFSYKISSNVWLGGFAVSEPSLSIACCAGPDLTTRSRQFQCFGRILSESLTCPVDWTRSPPPTHALWPLCGSCYWNTHAITGRGKVWPLAPGLEPGSHHRSPALWSTRPGRGLGLPALVMC